MQKALSAMHFFDYSFLSSMSVPANIMDVAVAIGELRTLDGFRRKDHPGIFEAMEVVARVKSVKSSNAIEGIVTSDARIASIVNDDSVPLDHNEQEIAGYRDALDLIHAHYEELKVDERTILELHRLLLGHTPEGSQGYKTTDNVIATVGPDGRQNVRFRPTSAEDTPADMEQLILAYSMAHSETNVNKLLLIGCFVLDFLCIHPFADGNGRLSRLLTLLLLYKNGYEVGKYVSLEAQIDEQRAWYYESLRASSVGWHDNENDCLPFLECFLGTLLSCYRKLDERFAIVQDTKTTKSERVELMVENALFPLAKRDIIEALPDVSPSTIESVLGKMVREGRAEKVGSYKNARYIGAPTESMEV